MRYLFILAIFFVSCTHKQIAEKKSRTDFFQSDADAFKKVQQSLQQHNAKEQLIRIDNITYIDATQKSYAIVFFQSNMGNSNMAFEKLANTTTQLNTISIKCTGEYCDCKVSTIITREGDVSVKCNCQTCTMHTKTY